MRGRFAALLLLSASLLGAQTREQFDSMPDWVRFLLAVPGVPQIYLGQPEGYAYAVIGIPTLVAGTGLYAWYLAGDRADADAWKLDTGLLASEIGSSFSSYSLYAFLRDRADALGSAAPRKGRESYLELLGAPYNPGVLLDYRALPVVGLELAAFLSPETIAVMGDYFKRSAADFMGLSMPASLALASEIGYAMAVNLFVAVAEETLFRGSFLELFGPLASSLTFGAVHATNLLFEKEITAEAILRVALQTGFATLAGWYLAMVTVDKGYDLRPAIAYHYWHNVIAMVTSFLYDGGSQAATYAGAGTPGLSLQFVPAGPSISITVPLP
jgi:membrane protease YdiL (CAAX protease family)